MMAFVVGGLAMIVVFLMLLVVQCIREIELLKSRVNAHQILLTRLATIDPKIDACLAMAKEIEARIKGTHVAGAPARPH